MEDLYRKAVDNWGDEAQIKMAIEEMGELIVALSHFPRGKATLEDVASEVADVKIMMKQLEYIINREAGKELVKEQENHKKERLKGILEFEE